MGIPHGARGLATLGIKIAAATVWEILKAEGVGPTPDRRATVWADFLHSQADALLACDFIETVTLTGQRQYILAAIKHTSGRVRVLGTTAHPTAHGVAKAAETSSWTSRTQEPVSRGSVRFLV
ncbi:hypothetical protein GCM10023205_82390 [Yinghuangia aomiensis]|uniref:Uncharacterized protein n=1 Tax=Yinghuangia aomiensis TaxID=676205 RepID=A0ABP9IGG6_9ACTN